jgi:hypothetical protein
LTGRFSWAIESLSPERAGLREPLEPERFREFLLDAARGLDGLDDEDEVEPEELEERAGRGVTGVTRSLDWASRFEGEFDAGFEGEFEGEAFRDAILAPRLADTFPRLARVLAVAPWLCPFRDRNGRAAPLVIRPGLCSNGRNA